jgi:hypothetical protein
VSSSAGTCPNCGAKVKKPVGALGLIFAALLLVGIFSAIFGGEAAKDRAQAAEAQKSPEQRTAEANAKAADLARYSAAVAASEAIKGSLRDPASLTWEAMSVNADATIVCAVYRAKNGFGGMNQEFSVFVNGKVKDPATTWNNRCKGEMYDQLYAVK